MFAWPGQEAECAKLPNLCPPKMPPHQTATSLFSLVVSGKNMHRRNAFSMFLQLLTESAFRINAMPSKFCFRGEALNRLYKQPKKTFKRAAVHAISKNIKTLECSIDSNMPANIRTFNQWQQQKDAEELRKEVEIGHKSSLRTNGLHGFDIISTLSFCLHASFVFTCIHNFPARWLECWRCRRAWWDRIPFDHEPANVANVVENHSCNALQSSEPPPVDSSPRGPLGSLRQHTRNRDVGIFQYEQILWYDIFTQSVAWHVL